MANLERNDIHRTVQLTRLGMSESVSMFSINRNSLCFYLSLVALE